MLPVVSDSSELFSNEEFKQLVEKESIKIVNEPARVTTVDRTLPVVSKIPGLLANEEIRKLAAKESAKGSNDLSRVSTVEKMLPTVAKNSEIFSNDEFKKLMTAVDDAAGGMTDVLSDLLDDSDFDDAVEEKPSSSVNLKINSAPVVEKPTPAGGEPSKFSIPTVVIEDMDAPKNAPAAAKFFAAANAFKDAVGEAVDVPEPVNAQPNIEPPSNGTVLDGADTARHNGRGSLQKQDRAEKMNEGPNVEAPPRGRESSNRLATTPAAATEAVSAPPRGPESSRKSRGLADDSVLHEGDQPTSQAEDLTAPPRGRESYSRMTASTKEDPPVDSGLANRLSLSSQSSVGDQTLLVAPPRSRTSAAVVSSTPSNSASGLDAPPRSKSPRPVSSSSTLAGLEAPPRRSRSPVPDSLPVGATLGGEVLTAPRRSRSPSPLRSNPTTTSGPVPSTDASGGIVSGLGADGQMYQAPPRRSRSPSPMPSSGAVDLTLPSPEGVANSSSGYLNLVDGDGSSATEVRVQSVSPDADFSATVTPWVRTNIYARRRQAAAATPQLVIYGKCVAPHRAPVAKSGAGGSPFKPVATVQSLDRGVAAFEELFLLTLRDWL
ncbi:hypothetical protein HK405_001939, partial [Cladochytrium tenue]